MHLDLKGISYYVGRIEVEGIASWFEDFRIFESSNCKNLLAEKRWSIIVKDDISDKKMYKPGWFCQRSYACLKD